MVYAYGETGKYKVTGIKENIEFAVKRIKKLYPLHLITLVTVAGVIALGLIKKENSQTEISEFVFYFIMNISLLHSLIPWRDGYFSFNAVSWYLSVSMICYFFFPWILNRLRKSSKKDVSKIALLTLTIQIAIALILQMLYVFAGVKNDFLKWATYINPFYRIGDVIVGAILGWLYLKIKPKRIKKSCHFVLILIFLIVVLLLQIGLYDKFTIPRAFVFDLYWLPVSVACVHFASTYTRTIENILGKVLIYIGDISGYAFLIHQIVIKGIERFVSERVLLTLLSFVLTIVCTEIFIRTEKTIKRFIRK